MQSYYQILGVSAHASQEEIRSAYRKLVVRYHPDRNPAPEAAEKIRAVNRAYDVLGDPEKRRKYDLSLAIQWDPAPSAPHAPPHRDPAYRRPRPTYTPRQAPAVSEWMLRFRTYAYRISWVAFGFCILLAIDGLLPSKTVQEKVTFQTIDARHRRPGKGYDYFITIQTNYGTRISFGTIAPGSFDQDRIVSISRSRLLSIPRRVAGSGDIVEKVPATLFGNFIFLPVVLFITSGLGVFFKERAHLQNSLGVVNAFILFLCFVFYLLFS